MNPYWGADFFSFFTLVVCRLFGILSGQLALSDLTCDEIQLGALMLVGVSASLLSPFLVLKRKTMMANSLSHTALFGLVLCYLALNCFSSHEAARFSFYHPIVLLAAAALSAFLTTFLTDFCQKKLKLHEEASVALGFTLLFALGLILVSLYTKKAHISVEVIMGNIDAILFSDLYVCLSSVIFNLAFVGLFFNYYKIYAFDETLAYSMHAKPKVIHYLLMMQTSFCAFASFRVVGVFLFLIFLTAPFLAARLFVKKLKSLIALSALLSCIAAFISVALSRHLLTVYDLSLSTGALTCCLISSLYPTALFIASIRKKRMAHLYQKRLITQKG